MEPYFRVLVQYPAPGQFSINTSVFLISEENTSDPTMGQNGTLFPSSCAIPSARAVFPVPGGPTNNIALPAIFFASDQINYEASSLSGLDLTNKSSSNVNGRAGIIQSQAFNMTMSRNTLSFDGTTNFFDFHFG